MGDRADETDDDRSGEQTESWETILSRRVGREADAQRSAAERRTAEMRAFGAPKQVRLSDLASPAGKIPPAKQPQVAPDPRLVTMLRKELETSEAGRTAAEARIVELQKEIEGLRDMIEHSNAGEVEQLRLQLTEAYEIIRMIEQAYLSGQTAPGRPPSGGR